MLVVLYLFCKTEALVIPVCAVLLAGDAIFLLTASLTAALNDLLKGLNPSHHCVCIFCNITNSINIDLSFFLIRLNLVLFRSFNSFFKHTSFDSSFVLFISASCVLTCFCNQTLLVFLNISIVVCCCFFSFLPLIEFGLLLLLLLYYSYFLLSY